MKKYLASLFLIITFVLFAVFQRKSTGSSNAAPDLASTDTTPTSSSPTTSDTTNQQPLASGSSPTPNNSTGNSNNSAVTTPQTNTGKYKNGSYTGSSADAYYGNVQVKAIIKNGKISDVQFLDHPSDRSRSMMINNQAMPILRSEAIQAQSANVDAVSGASMTSGAFIQSLQSALDKAAN